ncbi:helix-turn-helix domain-containing protein [Catellatospora vulcania]|uniref:helix-turn-helix domain-containing protein n=1 Tax=Catellatospora vulcania TaxID=1460450 RepID=UPI0012D4376D|nr:helix-turn-helix transcriptional regulator [Catellatospora vulcania]
MHLTPRERSIVALLAAGHTDAAIAAQLDISVRTIAYTLSALMDRYAVTNRFQLGLRLGEESAQQADPDGPEEPGPEQA